MHIARGIATKLEYKLCMWVTLSGGRDGVPCYHKIGKYIPCLRLASGRLQALTRLYNI